MGIPRFPHEQYSGLTDQIEAHATFVKRHLVAPFVSELDHFLLSNGVLKEFKRLQTNFLGSRIQATCASPQLLGQSPHGRTDEIHAMFFALSPNKDLLAVLRRFTLGLQPRGVHLKMVAAKDMFDHVARARELVAQR